VSYYELLGCSPNATKEEIHLRYKQLSVAYHPDKGATCSEMIKKLNNAYSTLSDTSLRNAYDAQLLRGQAQWVSVQQNVGYNNVSDMTVDGSMVAGLVDNIKAESFIFRNGYCWIPASRIVALTNPQMTAAAIKRTVKKILGHLDTSSILTEGDIDYVKNCDENLKVFVVKSEQFKRFSQEVGSSFLYDAVITRSPQLQLAYCVPHEVVLNATTTTTTTSTTTEAATTTSSVDSSVDSCWQDFFTDVPSDYDTL